MKCQGTTLALSLISRGEEAQLVTTSWIFLRTRRHSLCFTGGESQFELRRANESFDRGR